LTAIASSMSRAAAREALAERFRAAAIDAPQREASLLIGAACGLRAVDLIADPDAPLGETAAQVEALARRRERGEPLSRILRRREFWSLELTISPDVLDPRPETETIVEAALARLAGRREEALRVLDLGVGSGALLCALLSELPAARGVGVDRSPAAAAIARANVETLGLAQRAQIRVGDWAAEIDGPFDLIVSNPPYIRSGDIAALAPEVRDHDPRLALDGGADGLDAYRALAPQIANRLTPGGWFLLEVGAGQAEEVEAIAVQAGLVDVETFADLSGIPRVVAGRARAAAA
jgi:release factor glutamine methyltransferase